MKQQSFKIAKTQLRTTHKKRNKQIRAGRPPVRPRLPKRQDLHPRHGEGRCPRRAAGRPAEVSGKVNPRPCPSGGSFFQVSPSNIPMDVDLMDALLTLPTQGCSDQCVQWCFLRRRCDAPFQRPRVTYSGGDPGSEAGTRLGPAVRQLFATALYGYVWLMFVT